MLRILDKYGNLKVKETILSGSISSPTSAQFANETSIRSAQDKALSLRIDGVSAWGCFCYFSQISFFDR